MITTAQAIEAPSITVDVPQTTSLAAFCKAAGDPLRLDILRVLRHNAYGVLELCELLEVKQSGMSHHLKVLANAGLVATRREGNSIFYRRSPLPAENSLGALHRSLFTTIDQLRLSPEQEQRIARINQERTKASREFFEQNTDRFQANQDLIASYAQYGDIVTEFLDAILRNTQQNSKVLEVGPGEGSFLLNLSRRFDKVIALDTSDTMLQRSRKVAREQRLTNVEFLHGDTSLAVEQQLSVNVITLNMVLHHTPDPATIFEDLAQVLTTNGALLVTELCHHDQGWTRESCGDLWLGFEPDDLSQWATAAGLSEGESLYLAQRNGFQLQLRQFFKNTN